MATFSTIGWGFLALAALSGGFLVAALVRLARVRAIVPPPAVVPEPAAAAAATEE